FVAQHGCAALAQRVLIVHHEDANPRLRIGPDRQQGRDVLRLVTRSGPGDAVLCKWHGHRVHSSSGWSPLTQGSGQPVATSQRAGFSSDSGTNAASHPGASTTSRTNLHPRPGPRCTDLRHDPRACGLEAAPCAVSDLLSFAVRRSCGTALRDPTLTGNSSGTYLMAISNLPAPLVPPQVAPALPQ